MSLLSMMAYVSSSMYRGLVTSQRSLLITDAYVREGA